MNAEESRKFEALEKALRELQDKFARLSKDTDRPELEKTYSSILDMSATCALPWWVREMIDTECAEIFDDKSSCKRYRGDLSMGSVLRFALYYAVMYPERIEYVSLNMLREKKAKLDGIDAP